MADKCSNTKTMGHGDYAKCGEFHYTKVYLCEDCLTRQLAEAKAAHQIALTEFYDLATEHAPLVVKHEQTLRELAEIEENYAYDMRYIVGIVERGTGKPIIEGRPIRHSLLEYVKGLEQQLAEARKELADVCDTENILAVKLAESVSECEELKAEVARLEQSISAFRVELRGCHMIECNYPTQRIGGPGCVCKTINKHRVCKEHLENNYKLPEIGNRTNRKEPRAEIARLRKAHIELAKEHGALLETLFKIDE